MGFALKGVLDRSQFYTIGSIGLFEGVTVYCFKKKGVPERTPRNYYTFRNKVVTGFTLL